MKRKTLFYILFSSLAAAFLFYGLDFSASKGESWHRQPPPSNLNKHDGSTTVNSVEKKDVKILVDVKGAVKRPGVYEMKRGDRVVDVVKVAGGLTKEADRRRVNLAKKLADEMVIYVPKKGEKPPPLVAAGSSVNAGNGKLNINQATKSELIELPGIGPAKATSIITYRKQHGPFRQLNELLKVKGIGDKSLEALKKLIQVR